MKHNFWFERWEKDQIRFHRQDVNPRLLSGWPKMSANAGARVFVPLCGKSVDMIWLAEQGFQVIGIELAELAISAFFAENSLDPQMKEEEDFRRWSAGSITILQGDFFAMGPATLGPVDYVYDRASLIAMPPEMRKDYAEALQTVTDLAPTLLITLEYDRAERKGPPFSVPEAEVSALFSLCYDIELLDTHDVLEEEPRFKERGMTRLEDKVYRMLPRKG